LQASVDYQVPGNALRMILRELLEIVEHSASFDGAGVHDGSADALHRLQHTIGSDTLSIP
jgi:hypothetical protein